MKLNLASTSLAVALSVVMLGAACNDDNNNVTPTPVPTPTPTPAPEATPTPAPTPTPTPGPTAGLEVSFLGKVKGVDMEESLIRVNSDDVFVTSSTAIQREDGTPISMKDIPMGASVRVKGNYNDDASAIIGKRITLLQ